MGLPSWNVAPARTRATRWGAFRARHRAWADSMSLNAIATPAARERALQNVRLELILKAGRQDAEYSSRLLGAVDPMSVKHTVADETVVERTHPTFFPLLEQWE